MPVETTTRLKSRPVVVGVKEGSDAAWEAIYEKFESVLSDLDVVAKQIYDYDSEFVTDDQIDDMASKTLASCYNRIANIVLSEVSRDEYRERGCFNDSFLSGLAKCIDNVLDAQCISGRYHVFGDAIKNAIGELLISMIVLGDFHREIKKCLLDKEATMGSLAKKLKEIMKD